MTALKDISTLDHIKQMVDLFYGRVRKDDLLKDIFNEVIQERWPEHLEKMYRFWQTVLFDERTYYGAPFVPHADLPVHKEHFNRWVSLFHHTVDSLFSGTNADRAKWQGNRMAEMFLLKINFRRDNNTSRV